jgi:hypothetical protein
MGEISMLNRLVVSTLNKLPNLKPDSVRMDDSWEDWDMKQFILAIQVWLKRNKIVDTPNKEGKKRDPHWYTQQRENEPRRNSPVCLFCKESHWGDQCKSYATTEEREKVFVDNETSYQKKLFAS